MGKEALTLVKEWRPDAVITSDDNAQEYFATKLRNTSTPVIFCGVNADPSKYGFPARNVSGIIERSSLHRSLDSRHYHPAGYAPFSTEQRRPHLQRCF